MNRREFITLLGGAAALSWPLAACAQEQAERMRRIGVLMALDENLGQAFYAAFREGLQRLGWAEGRNIRIDTRWATARDVELRQRFAEGARRAAARPEDLHLKVVGHRLPATCVGDFQLDALGNLEPRAILHLRPLLFPRVEP
jgi:hypothetical protein